MYAEFLVTLDNGDDKDYVENETATKSVGVSPRRLERRYMEEPRDPEEKL